MTVLTTAGFCCFHYVRFHSVSTVISLFQNGGLNLQRGYKMPRAYAVFPLMWNYVSTFYHI